MFYRLSPHFAVEPLRQFGRNAVGFQLAKRARQWYINGCYLDPDDTSTIESVVITLKKRPRGAALLVAGDLNTTLTEPESNQRGTEIVAVLTEEGIKDMATHFLPRQRIWSKERRTCSMVRECKVFPARTDYILGTYLCLFWNVYDRDPRYKTDHYMIFGCLCIANKRDHTK